MKKLLYSLLGFGLVVCIVSCGSKNDSSDTDEESEADYSVTTSIFTETSGVISDSNETFYKVKDFISGQKYLIGYLDNGELTALSNDDKGSYITYTYNQSGGSNSSVSSSLTIDSYTLNISSDELIFEEAKSKSSSLEKSQSLLWQYSDSKLSCTVGDSVYYLLYDEGFKLTTDESSCNAITIFTNGTYKSKCIETQPSIYPYSLKDSIEAPTYTVDLYDDVVLDDCKWYLNENQYDNDSLTFMASDVTSYEYGVYPVYSTVEGHDTSNYYYSEKSYTINYIICEGILENSLLTFSDIHEEYYMMGDAIEDIMNQNSGKIPSLIVCTGDWVNGRTPEDDVLRSVYLPQVKGQLGGIDAVYVAGNHESYLGVAEESINSHLGADESNLDGIGVIFDSTSADYETYAVSSKYLSDLIVFGINYFALETTDSDGNTTYSYDKAIADLKEYLEGIKDSYNGELIMISAHAGLHTLGVDPNSSCSDEFAGGSQYNIDLSNEMVDLLNYYAINYDMSFTFLFGHNHSKNEDEMIITPGERMISTNSCTNKVCYNQMLYFSYQNAGYLSNEIGSADATYTLITWDDSSYYLNLKELEGKSIITAIDK